MSQPRSIAVFCGARAGVAPHHARSAEALGQGMAARGIRLVYGGGNIGLMGVLSRAVREAGGEVAGVIPDFLMKLEVGDTSVPLEITDSMHSRKSRMFELADAFVTLAGGLGTLDETVEIITWKQLRLHDKPIVILSEDGFWERFQALVDGFVEGGFAGAGTGELFQVVGSVEAVFEALTRAPAPGMAASSERL